MKVSSLFLFRPKKYGSSPFPSPQPKASRFHGALSPEYIRG